MKKYIYGISAAVICTLLSVQLAHSINNDKFDGFLSSNVEALAQSEEPQSRVCWNSITTAEGMEVWYCGDCLLHPGRPTLTSRKSECY